MEIEGEKYDLSYETLWKAIIRPPRDIYTPDDLIDNIFTFKKKTYYRKDYERKTKYIKQQKKKILFVYKEIKVHAIIIHKSL